MAQADTESTRAPISAQLRPTSAEIEAARAALPEAVFSLPVFQPLEAAKAYIGALNIMALDPDLSPYFGKPFYRLVCDISDILDDVSKELDRVYVLARRATGLPELPDALDDGNGEVEEAAGVDLSQIKEWKRASS